MERELRVAVIGYVQTSGGPSSPAPPAPTPPSFATTTSVGHRVSPPPPPRATAADGGRRGPPSPPPRTGVANRARRGSPPLPHPQPPRRRPSEDGVSISWGHKKKRNGGPRRPRPIGCVYPKFQAPRPRGRPRPEPIPAMRRKGVEAVLVGTRFETPKKALTGNAKIDEANHALCDTYGAMFASVNKFQNQSAVNPDLDQSALRTNICDLRTSAFHLRRVVIAARYKPVNEPLLFKGVCPRKSV